MPTFEDPTDKMTQAFEEVRALEPHRDRLATVDIRVFAVYAAKDEDDEPRGEAMQKDGDPLMAKIRIMGLEDRADGSGDVRLLLHGDRWGSISAGMQRSIIDTHLTRITVRMEDGKPSLDELGRPKLKKNKWDFQHCGFHAVAERHGRSSVEVHNLRVMFDKHGQIYMPHINPEDAPEDLLAPRPKKKKKKKSGKKKKKGDPTKERGDLGAKALRERIQYLERTETILGVAKLELEGGPRDDVIVGLKDRVREKRILVDYIALTKGNETSVAPDVAAAVLVTSRVNPSTDLLDQVVPECGDELVLGWVLDDERNRDEEMRPEVIEVVERRIAEIRPVLH